MNNNNTIKLSDRRSLAYAEYGPAEGRPVIAFHGTPGSRLEQMCDLSILKQLNTRLIVVDRPGYGLSDFQQDRTLLDWPDDISQLADALDLDRFSILGYSGGGPYAAACAFKIPQRLIRVALLSSAAPFDAPGVIDAMLPANRGMFELAANDYQQAARQLAALITTPDAVLTMMEAPASAPDKRIFSDENFRHMYTTNLVASLRQGLTGFTYDMSLIARPWGFDPATIKVKVDLWHGGQDINVPLAMGQYLANTMPQCTAHFLPDAGHLLMFAHGKEILQIVTRTS